MDDLVITALGWFRIVILDGQAYLESVPGDGSYLPNTYRIAPCPSLN
jgi:hypothetical protein